MSADSQLEIIKTRTWKNQWRVFMKEELHKWYPETFWVVGELVEIVVLNGWCGAPFLLYDIKLEGF